MAGPSLFSTPANFAKLQSAKSQLVTAVNEANLAVQAGLPNATQAATTAQDALKRVEQVLAVYFPTGAPGGAQQA